MRSRWIVAVASLSGCVSGGSAPPPATQPTGVDEGGPGDAGRAALDRAREILAAAGLDLGSVVREADVARAVAAGLTEDVVSGLLEDLCRDCLARDARCEEMSGSRIPEARRRVLETLLAVLGEIGSESSVPLLYRLDRRGLFAAGRALQRRLERTWLAERAQLACAPPSDEEVADVRGTLEDFAALRARDGRIVAEPLTPAERDDLAYFLAAAGESGPEVGEVPEAGEASWTDPAPPDPGRERLRDEIEAAKWSGDLDAVFRAGMSYLESMGYPGPLRATEEDEFAWGGARYSYVMRDVAIAAEALGRVDAAADLQRRARPGGGACGTSTDSLWRTQVEGLIRAEERRGRCRAVLPERLLAVDGIPYRDDRPTYGTAEPAAAGFDVVRLYRGALLTAYRDTDPEDLAGALAAAPAPLGDAASARLAARGPEAWETRVLALEGLADTAQHDAIPVLLDAALSGLGDVRLRALRALGALAERPHNDPCLPILEFTGSGSSEWRREIRPLGRECATKLSDAESGDLERALLPLLGDADPLVRAAATGALGAVGSPGALEALRPLEADPYTEPGVERCEEVDGEDVCGPVRPVRDASLEAIRAIEERERAWREQASRAGYGPDG